MIPPIGRGGKPLGVGAGDDLLLRLALGAEIRKNGFLHLNVSVDSVGIRKINC